MNVRTLFMGFQKALLEAQAMGREQHRRQLERYLGDEGEPETIRIQLPGEEGDGEAGRKASIEVPVYALIPRNSLQMKDAEIELDVDLTWLSPGEKGGPEDAPLDLSRLEVRAVGPPGAAGPRARLRVRFEAARLSEEDLPVAELEIVETAPAE